MRCATHDCTFTIPDLIGDPILMPPHPSPLPPGARGLWDENGRLRSPVVGLRYANPTYLDSRSSRMAFETGGPEIFIGFGL